MLLNFLPFVWILIPPTHPPSHLPSNSPSSKSLVAFMLLNFLPFAWIFFSMGIGKRMYGDMAGTVGKDAGDSNIDRSLTFNDVAGIDRAKREVQELVDMLKAPQKYGKLGTSPPPPPPPPFQTTHSSIYLPSSFPLWYRRTSA